MRRRDFIKGIVGSAVAASPLSASAQRTMPVIGYLDPTSLGDFAEPQRGFHHGLRTCVVALHESAFGPEQTLATARCNGHDRPGVIALAGIRRFDSAENCLITDSRRMA